MTNWSTLFPGRVLIDRDVYDYQASAYVLTAPARAAFVRASMVGGGSHLAGAAFARVKAVCTPGEGFTLAIGNCSETAAGDTILTRTTGSVVICRADGASASTPGASASCVGDTKRSGSLATVGTEAGASAGDDADTYPLGYGGPGALINTNTNGGNDFRSPGPGGGGIYDYPLIVISTGPTVFYRHDIPAGRGRATIEWFSSDPGY